MGITHNTLCPDTDLVHFLAVAQVLGEILTGSLHNYHELRGKVPDYGKVEQHVGDGDQVLEESEPTEGCKGRERKGNSIKSSTAKSQPFDSPKS